MKIIFFNQYYLPDTAATAQQLADLCEGLASSNQVTVICGRPSYDPAFGTISPRTVDRKGRVRVLRVPSTTFHRSRMAGRLSNYLTYLFAASFAGLLRQRPDIVVAMTDPPLIGLIAWAVARMKKVPFVYIVQDMHPDIGVALGRLKNNVVIQILSAISLFLFNRANQLIAISPSMKERLIQKGVNEDKIKVISNWVDTSLITPESKDNSFSRQHKIAGRFVVMYSGNVGLSQNLLVLIRAAKMLEDLNDMVVAIIGEGAGKERLMQEAKQLELRNVLFLSYQPLDQMRYSFAAADVFLVSLAGGLDGLIVPSKVFSIMASGRPFIALIDSTSEVAHIARTFGCGLVVKPGDEEGLAESLRWAYGHREELKAMGHRGRRGVESLYSREQILEKYREILTTLVGKG